MKILIAPDKFKGSLSATQVCEAIEEGILKNIPNSEITKMPLADGGEGSLLALENTIKFKRIYLDVKNPLYKTIKTFYGLLNGTAYIEMSSASGLQLLKPSEYSAMNTSTYGTGEMILDALNKGAKKIYLFIGGSATNDAGVGMAAALGYKLLDSTGSELEPSGANLIKISEIDCSKAKSFDGIEFNILTDVNNKLFGLNGAAHIFAKQKGASSHEIIHLDKGLKNISKIWEKKFNKKVHNINGSGAAGGLGAGAIVFCNGKIKSGLSIIFELVKLDELVQKADLVISGEGLLDQQTFSGKVIKGVSEICYKKNKPFGILCGDLSLSKSQQELLNTVFIKSIKTKKMSAKESMKNAYDYLVELSSKTIQEFI